ncbi:hypothetical protein [Chitinophaga sp. sic0106]|uniref:hypothetical protein n=1 Tax=Chitinophaga sp. sic0106 TaxID=2854785 RepID=UPI001C439462|nr:hypothetical protein [Chitinophaga sp. sic0106]MBV7533914.1 hypothetical protein [Chitinophaga sp. sic0106]
MFLLGWFIHAFSEETNHNNLLIMTMRSMPNFKYIISSVLLLLMTTFTHTVFSQCDNWRLEIATDTSRCPISGKIAVTLIGPNVASLSDITYSLAPKSGEGTVITNTSLPILTGIEPGIYIVTVGAMCGGNKVTKSATAQVIGTYPDFYPYYHLNTPSYGTCNNGEIKLELEGGRAPFRVTYEYAPPGVDTTSLILPDNNYKTFRGLPGGEYKINVVDACGTSQYLNPVTVPVESNQSFYTYIGMERLTDCSGLKLHLIANSSQYFYPDTNYYSLAFDGGGPSPWKRISESAYDTLLFGPGKTISDNYGKLLTLTVTSTCLDTSSFTREIPKAYLSVQTVKNCVDSSYDIKYTIWQDDFGQTYSCPPYLVTLYDSTNKIVYRRSHSIEDLSGIGPNLKAGKYRLELKDANNVVQWEYTMNVLSYISFAVRLRLDPTSGEIATGRSNVTSIIALINGYPGIPSNMKWQMLYPYAGTYSSSALFTGVIWGSPSYQNNQYQEPDDSPIMPGSYLFRFIYDCDTVLVPFMVTDQDVATYSWDYTSQWECGGLRVFPTITGYHPKNTFGYQLVESPTIIAGRDATSFFLAAGGYYNVALRGNSYSAKDWGINTKTFNTIRPVLAVDTVIGWICPGGPDNSGVIRIRAKDGGIPNGPYTYQLANKGQGETGPYIASNQTGNFSSGSSYSLMKDMEYSIKITDPCGNFIIQDVKIYDFAAMQLIKSSSYYCSGDVVQLRVELPGINSTYAWKGPKPSGLGTRPFQAIGPYALINNFRSGNAGIYSVEIFTDLCPFSLKDTVEIKLAPSVNSCISAVTDTTVNPVTVGLLGNWQAKRSYLYYDNRKEKSTDVATNIRTDGTYDTFRFFWRQGDGNWVKDESIDTTKWVWNVESMAINSSGSQLESRNALGIYNAALFGYNNNLQIADVVNGRYRSAAFEGFEDYDFKATNCNENGTCVSARHFDFSGYSSQIDSTEHHTGRYSIRVEQSKPVAIKVPVVQADVPAQLPDFRMAYSACNYDSVLAAVRLNSSVLLPTFSPLVGTNMYFSAWVKEEQPCATINYEKHKVTIFVGGAVRQTIELKPAGGIIDGWQRYEQSFNLPVGDSSLTLMLEATTSSKVYFDDIRFHPYNANMKSYVYSSLSLKMMATLDENNYATFYEYDDDGTLIRVKKETERGVKTISESRTGLIQSN